MNKLYVLAVVVIGFFILLAILTMYSCGGGSPVVNTETELVMMAPIAPPGMTIVYSMWGSSTYHRDTCRFIINSKKPVSCLFSFPASKAVDMKLKPCSNCFKASKEADLPERK